MPITTWCRAPSAPWRAPGISPWATGWRPWRVTTGGLGSIPISPRPRRTWEWREGLLAGVTTVADHHFTWPDGVAALDMVEATVAAARRLGARLVFGYGLGGELPGGGGLRSGGGDGSPSGSQPRWDGADGVRTGWGPLRRPGDFRGVRRGRPAVGTPAAHPGQRGDRRGARRGPGTAAAVPFEILEDWGWLEPDVTIAHLCGISPAERARLAGAGISATHAPGFDIPMGLGVCEVGVLIDAGVPVGLGTSGGGYNDAGNLLADARAGSPGGRSHRATAHRPGVADRGHFRLGPGDGTTRTGSPGTRRRRRPVLL